jgi:hypothetical protein
MNESSVFTLSINPAEVGHTTTLILRLGGGACVFPEAGAESSSDSNGDGGGLPPVAGVGTGRDSWIGFSGHVLAGIGVVYVVEWSSAVGCNGLIFFFFKTGTRKLDWLDEIVGGRLTLETFLALGLLIPNLAHPGHKVFPEGLEMVEAA